MIVVKEDADLGLLGGRGTFDGIALEEVGYGWGLVPDRIVEAAVDVRRRGRAGGLDDGGFPSLAWCGDDRQDDGAFGNG